MVRYEKCPRCELNYIDVEKQEYCDVCIAEMKGAALQFADLDEEDYEELDMELGGQEEEICPICGVSVLRAGEKICDSCKNNREYEEEEEVDIEKDEEWKNYLDEDDGDMTVDENLQQELDAELAEEEKSEEEEFYEDVDPLADFEDDDYDDFEDDDDEDDDEDDDF